MILRCHKPLLIFLTLVVLSVESLWAQRPCDTLICSDGRRIPAQILHSKSGYIYYYHCSDFVKTENKIASSSVSGFAPFVRKESEDNKSFPTFSRLKTATEKWHKNSFIITAGLSLTDHLAAGDDIELESAFQMGVQFNPKKSLFQVAFYARPLRYYNTQRFDNFNSTGTNAEFTLSVKRVTYGRLSGVIKNGYLGLELQSGTRRYSYQEEVFSLGLRTLNTESTSRAVLARFGIQETFGPIYLDVSISVGPRSLRSQTTGGLNKETDSYDYISIQPVFGAGIHF